MSSVSKISLFCVLVSVVTAAFTPPRLFCATAGGQIACNIPCPEKSALGNTSEYCSGLDTGVTGLRFKYCFVTSDELSSEGTNQCPSTMGIKCADIGKTCHAPYPSSAQECPTSGLCDDTGGPNCDGTCGCGCAFTKLTTWLGFPGDMGEAPGTSCGYDNNNASAIFKYCK